MHMIVPVQHQIGAVLDQYRAKFARVQEAAEARAPAAFRRVMNQNHAKQVLVLQTRERLGEAGDLLASKLASRYERKGRYRGGQTDQDSGAAPPHEGVGDFL